MAEPPTQQERSAPQTDGADRLEGQKRGDRGVNIFSRVNISMLEHRVRDPAHTVNMVPVLANQSLLSGGKFAEAGYVSVCDGE